MKRARRSAEVSLFPFLSILACVIGTLTLLLAGLAVGEMLDPDLARRMEYVALVPAVEAKVRESTELERLLAQAAAVERRLADAVEEMKRLDGRWDTVRAGKAEDERLIVDLVEQVRGARQAFEEASGGLGALREKRDRLKQRLVARRKREAERNGRVLLQPQGGGTGKEPHFVECAGRTLTLHPGQPSRVVVTRGGVRGKAFADFLDDVKRRRGALVVFLIRRGAVQTFDEALTVVLAKKVPYGYLPVPGDKPLDFRLFQKPFLGLSVVSEGGGARILRVAPRSPSGAAAGPHEAGLVAGDVIVALAGHPVQSPRDLLLVLQGLTVGDEIRAHIKRKGKAMVVPIAVGAR